MTEYSKVPLKTVIPEKPLPTDIYVFLSGKYLKYLLKNTEFTADQYNKFIGKKVQNVYVHQNEIQTFLKWLMDERDSIIEKDAQKVGGKLRAICETNLELREKIFEVFSGEELDDIKVGALKNQADDFVLSLKEDPLAMAAITKLAKYNGSIADHSVNVANLSVFLGMTLGHAHPLVLQNLYLGGLFHDIGKTKVDPKYWENTHQSQTLYSQALQMHPEMGAKLLAQSGTFPDQVINIVHQHHEMFAGGGFPKGLQGKNIYELSRIVTMANIFDNACSEKKDSSLKMKIQRALKIFEYDRGKQFDPDLLERVTVALNFAYAEDLK